MSNTLQNLIRSDASKYYSVAIIKIFHSYKYHSALVLISWKAFYNTRVTIGFDTVNQLNSLRIQPLTLFLFFQLHFMDSLKPPAFAKLT